MPESVSKPIPQGMRLYIESNKSWEAARPGNRMAKVGKATIMEQRSDGTAGQAKGASHRDTRPALANPCGIDGEPMEGHEWAAIARQGQYDGDIGGTAEGRFTQQVSAHCRSPCRVSAGARMWSSNVRVKQKEQESRYASGSVSWNK